MFKLIIKIEGALTFSAMACHAVKKGYYTAKADLERRLAEKALRERHLKAMALYRLRQHRDEELAAAAGRTLP